MNESGVNNNKGVKMLVLSEIIEKLKDVISESKLGAKVFDKDVATALNIPQATFATMKKRNFT